MRLHSLSPIMSIGGGGRGSNVARGESGGTRPGAQQHTFCSHFKRVFKQKFRPKNA